MKYDYNHELFFLNNVPVAILLFFSIFFVSDLLEGWAVNIPYIGIVPINDLFLVVSVISIIIIWEKYFPAVQTYDIETNGISFKNWNSDFMIPFDDIKEARFRHFKYGKAGFNRCAITLFHNERSTELRFSNSSYWVAKMYFDEIKAHIGDKAKDLR